MRKKFTILICLFIASVMSQAVFAVPAVPWPVEKVQPDGTKVTVHVRGDEKVHWFESLDGYTLMVDANQYLVYAEKDSGGNLTPSKVRFNNGKAPQSLQKGLRYSPGQANTLKQIWEATASEAQNAPSSLKGLPGLQTRVTGPQRAPGGPQNAPATGVKKVLLLLADYPDRPMVHTQSEFDALMNQVGYTAGGAKGSVRDFYLENSYNQLELQVTVAGPYTVEYPVGDYLAEGEGYDARYTAQDALSQAAEDLDFTEFANPDNIVSGYPVVETFHMIFAGHGAEAGAPNAIWSHAWTLLSGYYALIDGALFYRYSCSPELRGTGGTQITYIGVIAHELGHVFGSPDYYDVSANNGGLDFIGTGEWDLMAGGSWNDFGRQPAHINPYQKIKYGWITPTPLLPDTDITGMPASATTNVDAIYKVEVGSSGEHYLLENKQPVGFDTSLPGHGLLIWHAKSETMSSGPNDNHPLQFYPVCASSTTAIPTNLPASYGNINSAGTPFAGVSGKTEFTDTSIPQAFTWTGLTGIDQPIVNIVNSGGTISFEYMPVYDDPVTNLQHSLPGYNVVLTWTAPANNAVKGYNIYRNGSLIYSIANAATTTYTHVNVVGGFTYTYEVSAVYPTLESVKASTVPFWYGGAGGAAVLPATDLAAKTTYDNVSLSWEAPLTGGWTGISGDYDFDRAYTWGDEDVDVIAGTFWSKDDLFGMDGYTIDKVRFVPREDEPGTTYDLVIYEVPTGQAPVGLEGSTSNATQVGSTQSLTPGNFTGVWNEFTLSAPHTIDASKGLIVGIKVHSKGTFPGYLTVDDGSNPHRERNVYYSEVGGLGGWRTFGNLGDPNFWDRNFCLGIEVSSTSVVSGYNIYRDGSPLGSTTNLLYNDTSVTPETAYSYSVTVGYSDGSESESVSIEATTKKYYNPNRPITNLQSNVVGLETVQLAWDAPYLEGKTLKYHNSTIDSWAGYAPTSKDWSLAAYFPVGDIKQMAGLVLKDITFYAPTGMGGPYPLSMFGDPSTLEYSIRVWTGTEASGPEELIYDDALTTYNPGLNTVTLSTPITLTEIDDLWIGLRLKDLTSGQTYGGIMDKSPAVRGKGNMLNDGTGWKEAPYPGYGYNWAISGTVAPGSDPLGQYIIERDGGQIGTATGTSYEDATAVAGTTYNYCVKADYGTGVVNTTPFSNGFESGTLTGWTRYDADGDWEYWYIDNVTGPTYAHSGNNFAFSESYYNGPLTPDNWLITPAISLTSNDELEYYVAAFNANYPADHYGVYISTTNTAIGSFTKLSEETITAVSANYVSGAKRERKDMPLSSGPKGELKELQFSSGPEFARGNWYKHTLDLSAYAGQTVYIGFRHFDCKDEWAIMLDDIKISGKNLSAFSSTSNSDAVCTSATTPSPYLPIDVLTAKVVGEDVFLEWTTSELLEGTSYTATFNIYADGNGSPIATNVGVKNFSITGVSAGSHTYCVEADYGSGHVATPVCKTVTVVDLGDPHRPVTNLQGAVVPYEYDATLTWEAPKLAQKLSQHTFTSGSQNNIGTGSAADFDIAARFTPAELKDPSGLMLSKIRFSAPSSITGITYSIRVWQGGDWNARDAGTLIVDQVVDAPTAGWNEVYLNNPVIIDPAQGELWIGLRCVTTGTYPAPMFMQDLKEGVGNLMFYQNNWVTATELGATLTGNWIVEGIAGYHQGLSAAPALRPAIQAVENRINSGGTFSAIQETVSLPQQAPPAATPTVVKYEIERNGSKIDETTNLFYNDLSVTASDTYTYGVKAVYDDATPSAANTVDLTFVSECDNAPYDVEAVRTDNKVKVTWKHDEVIAPGETPTLIPLQEDFTAGRLPDGWSTNDADSDGENWLFGNDDLVGGIGYAFSWSWYNYVPFDPDNWLITPQITLPENSALTYNVFAPFSGENYGVFISTTDANPGSFTSLFEEVFSSPAAPSSPKPDKASLLAKAIQLAPAGSEARSINLSAYAGQTVYIAFRHYNSYDKVILGIDDVKIEATRQPKPTNFNVYRNGDPIATNVTAFEYEDVLSVKNVYTYEVSFVGQNGCESVATVAVPDIDFRPITFAPIINSKFYDGTKDVDIQAFFDGLNPMDPSDVIDDVTDYTLVAQYASASAGYNVPIAVDLTLTPTAIAKYWITPTSIAAKAHIYAKELIIAGIAAENKEYDGTTDATILGTPVIGGIVSGDVVTLGAPTATFANANVGTGIPVSLSYTPTGAQAANYSLTIIPQAADITPKDVTVDGWNVEDKVYDGTTAATLDGTPALADPIAGDDVALSGTPTATFVAADAADNVAILLSPVTLTGAQAGNYSLTLPAFTANITPAPITITPDAGQFKPRLQADPVLTYTSAGWVLPDDDTLLVGDLERESGETMGLYDILQGTLDVTDSNYTIAFTGGVTFQIRAGVGLDDVDGSGLLAYPNPAKAGVPFTVVTAPDATIAIINANGILVKQQKAEGAKTEVSIPQAGVYILAVGSERLKIVVR